MVGMFPFTMGILGVASYAADAAVFDGVNDDLQSTSALSTVADGKEGILSIWVRFNSTAGDGVLQNIIQSSGSAFEVRKATDNTIEFATIASTAAVNVYQYVSTGTFTSTSTAWRHFLYTWSEANGFGARINASTSGVGSLPANSTRTTDYSVSEWAVGGSVTGSGRLYGDLCDVYLNVSPDGGGIGTVLTKFIASGKPVDLGSSGDTPTGTAPIMYLHMDDGAVVTTFPTNLGSGSSFAITGTLVASTSSPTD